MELPNKYYARDGKTFRVLKLIYSADDPVDSKTIRDNVSGVTKDNISDIIRRLIRYRYIKKKIIKSDKPPFIKRIVYMEEKERNRTRKTLLKRKKYEIITNLIKDLPEPEL